MKRQDIDKYYNEVKANLDGKLEKASEILSSSEQKLNETEANRQQSSTVLQTLNENYNSVISLINQTRDDLAKVTDLRAVALDPESGIDTILSKINSISEQADKLVVQISSYEKDSSKKQEQVNSNSENSTKLLAEISNKSKRANTLLEDLEKTYQLAINTGLAGSFDTRKKAIQEEFVNQWGKRLTVSFIVLGVISVGILAASWIIQGFTLEWLTIFRIALLLPLFFYTGYATVQYSNERKLLEKYAFKAVVAASIESYTSILKSNFGDKNCEKDLLEFMINSMKMIYCEPHEEIAKRSYGISIGNKMGQLKSEIIEEAVQRIKNEVKE